MAKKRIPAKENTVRTTVPTSLIKIRNKYKREIKKNLKPKHRSSLSDKVVLEVVMKSINDLPDKEILKIALKKIPKKYKV